MICSFLQGLKSTCSRIKNNTLNQNGCLKVIMKCGSCNKMCTFACHQDCLSSRLRNQGSKATGYVKYWQKLSDYFLYRPTNLQWLLNETFWSKNYDCDILTLFIYIHDGDQNLYCCFICNHIIILSRINKCHSWWKHVTVLNPSTVNNFVESFLCCQGELKMYFGAWNGN